MVLVTSLRGAHSSLLLLNAIAKSAHSGPRNRKANVFADKSANQKSRQELDEKQ